MMGIVTTLVVAAISKFVTNTVTVAVVTATLVTAVVVVVAV